MLFVLESFLLDSEYAFKAFTNLSHWYLGLSERSSFGQTQTNKKQNKPQRNNKHSL